MRQVLYVMGDNSHGQLGLGKHQHDDRYSCQPHLNRVILPCKYRVLKVLDTKGYYSVIYAVNLETNRYVLLGCGSNEFGHLTQTVKSNSPFYRELDTKHIFTRPTQEYSHVQIDCGGDHLMILVKFKKKKSIKSISSHPLTTEQQAIMSDIQKGCYLFQCDDNDYLHHYPYRPNHHCKYAVNFSHRVPCFCNFHRRKEHDTLKKDAIRREMELKTGGGEEEEEFQIWGSGLNTEGQLGTFAYQHPQQFVPISFKSKKIIKVACGYNHTLFLTEDRSELLVCGENTFGQAGVSAEIYESCIRLPMKVPLPEKVKMQKILDIFCGFDSSALLTLSHEIHVCGRNSNFELGVGDCQDKDCFVPIPLNTTRKIRTACMANIYSFYLTFFNEIYCSGEPYRTLTKLPLPIDSSIINMNYGVSDTLVVSTVGQGVHFIHVLEPLKKSYQFFQHSDYIISVSGYSSCSFYALFPSNADPHHFHTLFSLSRLGFADISIQFKSNIC